ncbi:zinc-binding dehydrogenase, partial [Micrococcus sp. SIMBA_144]
RMFTTEGREREGEILTSVARVVEDVGGKPELDKESFIFATIAEAHNRLESGKTIGKVVAENDLSQF